MVDQESGQMVNEPSNSLTKDKFEDGVVQRKLRTKSGRIVARKIENEGV